MTASTSSRWMRPPPMLPISPSSHRTNRIATIVQSMGRSSQRPDVAALLDSKSKRRARRCGRDLLRPQGRGSGSSDRRARPCRFCSAGPPHCGPSLDNGCMGSLRRDAPTAAALIPPRPTVPRLRAAAAGCRACDLWECGTQTVFGEGPASARVLFVGEQPGHEEDLAGRPFVGPAGRLLDQALAEAGIDRREVYVTNAVKHFKWEPRGKKRIHVRPNAQEIRACRPWLEAEIAVLRPEVLVLLGATAAQALLGGTFRVSRQRGQLVTSPLAPAVIATVHPSSILRAPDEAARRAERELFVRDLRAVAAAPERAGAPAAR